MTPGNHIGRLSGLLYVAVLCVLFVPLSQEAFRFGDPEPLHGHYIRQPDSAFTPRGWFEGSYQEQKEKYIKENFGFYQFYVRLHSQILFTFFHQTNAYGVIVGGDNFLYEIGYIDQYYGRISAEPELLKDKARKLHLLEDTLKSLGKLALMVIAPCKASYYPEYIPAHLRGEPATSDYLYLQSALRHYDVPHIDFNSYFVDQKHKSKYPLYPQYGIHWSNYGALLALDSISRYIETYLRINIPELEFQAIELSDDLRGGDDDIVKGMNLLCQPKTFRMAYPSVQVLSNDTVHVRPRVTTVGDSFWWYLYSTANPQRLFKDHQFWYYFNEVYTPSSTAAKSVSQLDFDHEFSSTDVFLIVQTPPSLLNPGHGVIDKLYDHYFGNK